MKWNVFLNHIRREQEASAGSGERAKRRRMIPALLAFCLSCALMLTACSAKEPADETALPAGPASARTSAFSDVPSDAWYAGAVQDCAAQGLMDGTSSTAFSPGAPASRAVLVMALYRCAGSPAVPQDEAFADIPAASPYRSAASWASQQGIVSGYKDGRFGGDDPVTREQFAAMLWRAEGKPAPGAAEAFADQAEIASYAVDAAAWAREAGIISGRADGRFDPKANITRGEAAVVLSRWLKRSDAQPAEDLRIELSAGGNTFSAALEDSPTARAFLALLPLEITMTELNGNEKYHNLSENLPSNAVRPGTISEGDLMLYGSNCLVLFYESFSSTYSYTRLGKLDNPEGLARAVGSGNVTVTIRPAQDRAASLSYDGVYPRHESYDTGTGTLSGRVVWTHNPAAAVCQA